MDKSLLELKRFGRKIHLIAEKLAKIESNTYISRFFFRDNFIEGVDKPEDSRSV